MGHIGPTELIIILVIVIIIFGAGKLPEIGGALGKGMKEFKAAAKELEGAKKDLESVTDPLKEKEDEAPKQS
jgi:sec-independent protein translocase protein TatA